MQEFTVSKKAITPMTNKKDKTIKITRLLHCKMNRENYLM